MSNNKLPFGWASQIDLAPERVKAAKEWWSSLSINEQKAFKSKHLGENYPNTSVYTKSGASIVLMWQRETQEK